MIEDIASTQTEGSSSGVSSGKLEMAAKGSSMYKQWRTIAGLAKGESAESIGSDLLGPIFGGLVGSSKESPDDMTKQKIQQKLANMGYSQFSKMGGWKGDETRKKNAMATILKAVQVDENNAGKITSWLDSGGNITPETIRKIRANGLTEKSSGPSMMGVSKAGLSGGLNARNLIIGGLLIFGGWYYIENYS